MSHSSDIPALAFFPFIRGPLSFYLSRALIIVRHLAALNTSKLWHFGPDRLPFTQDPITLTPQWRSSITLSYCFTYHILRVSLYDPRISLSHRSSLDFEKPFFSCSPNTIFTLVFKNSVKDLAIKRYRGTNFLKYTVNPENYVDGERWSATYSFGFARRLDPFLAYCMLKILYSVLREMTLLPVDF